MYDTCLLMPAVKNRMKQNVVLLQHCSATDYCEYLNNADCMLHKDGFESLYVQAEILYTFSAKLVDFILSTCLHKPN